MDWDQVHRRRRHSDLLISQLASDERVEERWRSLGMDLEALKTKFSVC